MSAEQSDHAAKVKRGMELSRAHKAGEHTEPNPDCAKCKAEAKQKGKVAKSPVPNAEAEVTLEGVPSMSATQTETITGKVDLPNITTITPGTQTVEVTVEDAPKKTPEQKEQEHIAAMEAAKAADREALRPIAPVANKPGEVGGDKVGYDILVHVLKDGFTVLGTVWYRGQEIGIKRGSPVDELSTDKNGNHWYDQTPVEQMARHGGVQVFGLGPWPFDKPDLTADEYTNALASGDTEAVRRYDKERQRAAMPVAPAGDRT